jgi:hypothetical protein
MRTPSSTTIGLPLLVVLLMQPLSTLASASAAVSVTIDGITTFGTSLAPDAFAFNAAGGGGAGQFAYTPSCTGLACGVDGPALSTYMASGNPSAHARGDLSYTVNVVGAPGPVPILLMGQYSFSDPLEGTGRTGGTALVAAVQVNSDQVTPRLFKFQSLCYDYDPITQEQLPEANCGTGTYSGSFMAGAGSTLTVSMFIDIVRLFPDRDLPSANGYFDPYFQIDPVYAAAHPGVSLVFDPGVGNGVPGALTVTPVPEPETLVLMAGGLGALALRRRRSKTGRTHEDAQLASVL